MFHLGKSDSNLRRPHAYRAQQHQVPQSHSMVEGSVVHAGIDSCNNRDAVMAIIEELLDPSFIFVCLLVPSIMNVGKVKQGHRLSHL